MSSNGTVCVEEGKAFSFIYESYSSTTSFGLEASVVWNRSDQNNNQLQYILQLYQQAWGSIMYYRQLLCYSTHCSDIIQSTMLSHGSVLASDIAQGNDDIYGTDSNDMDAYVH